jgi:hypothetical protein
MAGHDNGTLCHITICYFNRKQIMGGFTMSVLQREVFQIIYSLPENSLSSLKPLLNELLTSAVLLIDPSANIAEMDEFDKSLFLQAVRKIDNAEYVSFESALDECGVVLDGI